VHFRALGIESERATRVHQNYWLKLAREGGQCTVQHLAELEPLRRHATLTSLALDLTATLTDEALNMFEHLVGKLFKKSERAHTEQFHASGKSINEKVRLYVRVGQALIKARSSGGDAFAAIEAVLPWSKFESTVAEAQTLAQPEEFDYLALLDDRYSSVRKFAPLLLAHFEFYAAPAAAELLRALDLLRDLNASGKRTLPDHVPTGFVKPRWRPYVFTAGGVDRHFYELCALAELRDRLRAGDIWVTGSRQYRDFETYLIPAATFKTMQEEPLPLAIDNAQALAGLIDAQHRQPLAAHWGDGTTSSSDAQFFRAGGRGEVGGLVNLHYGQDPGVKFYTHLSDQFGPFHTKVIDATANEAPHVLDGLLYHKSSLVINEHYTDTGGFSDHVFAMCRLLGFRFAPRIRDLKEKRLYTLPGMTVPPELVSLVAGAINLRAISDHWFELLRLATSIKTGTVTASVILRKLAAYPRQNALAHALRELGKLERTLFTLDWLQDPELRRRSHVGLNKGEQQNALRRAVFFNRLGEVRDRSYENQLHRASGLNLLVAAIILWNTVYLQRAVDYMRKQGHHPALLDLTHLSPLGWEHINLTGDYHWETSPTLGPDQFRPLRTRPHDLAAAA
jgi:TnpA family transposase